VSRKFEIVDVEDGRICHACAGEFCLNKAVNVETMLGDVQICNYCIDIMSNLNSKILREGFEEGDGGINYVVRAGSALSSFVDAVDAIDETVEIITRKRDRQ
jgi:hypothetical protein